MPSIWWLCSCGPQCLTLLLFEVVAEHVLMRQVDLWIKLEHVADHYKSCAAGLSPSVLGMLVWLDASVTTSLAHDLLRFCSDGIGPWAYITGHPTDDLFDICESLTHRKRCWTCPNRLALEVCYFTLILTFTSASRPLTFLLRSDKIRIQPTSVLYIGKDTAQCLWISRLLL
jgi:hypothetical protein